MSKYVLDLPWGVRPPGVVYHKNISRWVYDAAKAGTSILPKELRPYQAQPFSYEEWVQNDLFGVQEPRSGGKEQFTPRPHQVEAADVIHKAYQKGQAGALQADTTGLGKTLSTLLGINKIAAGEGFGADTEKGKAKTLIVCPKAAIPVWRETILRHEVSHHLSRILIINYQQLKKLVQPSANTTARKSSKKRAPSDKALARGATTKIHWDFVVFDEEHYLKNYPKTAVGLFAATIAKLNNAYKKGQSPFVVSVTATPGETPLDLAMFSPWLAPLINKNAKNITPKKWGNFLKENKFAVKEQKNGWVWATTPWYGKNSSDPKEVAKYKKEEAETKKSQRRDSLRIGHALMSKEAPFISRSPQNISGWPEQQIIPLPIELTIKQRPIYEEAWSQFRKFLRLPSVKQDPKSRLVETLRYRQKSSLLKVPTMVDQIIDWTANGKQVFVSCEFLETLDKYAEELQKSGIAYAEVSGRTLGEEREKNRIAFQKGEAKVILSTVFESVSFHANELLPDGTKATSAERITVLSDLRQRNIANEQALGRAHRSGEYSNAYIPFLTGTIDDNVVNSYLAKTKNMKQMLGETEEKASLLDKLFTIAAAKS